MNWEVIVMGILEIIAVAIGLSMDAFAVSVCKGLAMDRITFRKASICGIWFGVFQALMPLVGYFIGNRFSDYIVNIDHWIAFGLLAIIGINMIKESFGSKEDDLDSSLGIKVMFLLAVATSIDALAVGVTFACVPVAISSVVTELANTLIAAGVIAVITYSLSCIGVKVGSVFGTKYKQKAELAGGIVLVIIGLKILIEHIIKSI